MMLWDYFVIFAAVALLCWIAGSWAAWKDKARAAYLLTAVGLVVFLAYIIIMWVSLERPPLRTMGETRLWYSFFLPLAGLIVYSRYKYKWILSFGTLMAMMFVCINIFKPEYHSKTLMPALQSPWFAPHVIVYMFAYALFGASFIMALVPTNSKYRLHVAPERKFAITDNLVYIGFTFLTLGMLFGALWAKEAWGHYWSWDPKETWAAITWFSYLAYIHLRLTGKSNRACVAILIVSFVFLQICWWGINYLPSAQGISIHTYNAN